MTHDHDDVGEELLAGIDLQVWRVPPPPAIHGPSLLVRAVTSGPAPAKRVRARWLLAALVLVNAAIAALLVIVLAPGSSTQTTVVAQPAGGGSVDAKVRELLQRLEQEQRELERRLAEIEELRALVAELAEKVQQYEQDGGKRERTVPKKHGRAPADRGDSVDPFERTGPAEPVATPPVNPFEGAERVGPAETRPVDPFERRPSSESGSCDEVTCVLTNDNPACCAKYRKPRDGAAKTPSANAMPETLDRASISAGISAVKPRVVACGRKSTAKGTVRARVIVGANGRVTNVTIATTPADALGACVAAAVQRATFSPTQRGGSFTYPFVF